MDKSLQLLNLLHPSIRFDAIEAYKEAVRITPKGVHPVITETVRSFQRSDDLYAQGRTKPGPIVSNAKGGESNHNYALALDIGMEINGKLSWVVDKNWLTVANCFKKRGFAWGGDWKFKDYPHFEKTFGLSTRQLLAMHKAKKYIQGETYLNITA